MELKTIVEKIKNNIANVIVGKDSAVELLIVALLSEGHVLIEDVPGVGKTMLARSLAISLGGKFKRLQCTPDLLPNDITGVSIFNQGSQNFEFRPGPLFVNVLWQMKSTVPHPGLNLPCWKRCKKARSQLMG